MNIWAIAYQESMKEEWKDKKEKRKAKREENKRLKEDEEGCIIKKGYASMSTDSLAKMIVELTLKRVAVTVSCAPLLKLPVTIVVYYKHKINTK